MNVTSSTLAVLLLAVGVDGCDDNDGARSANEQSGDDDSGRVERDGGFPSATCRSGFVQAGNRLCISAATQDALPYSWAAIACRDQQAHVCTYEDLSYLYVRTGLDSSYNPNGVWLGNMVDDDYALCGDVSIVSDNPPEIYDFEGVCHKGVKRAFWCCHDDSA